MTISRRKLFSFLPAAAAVPLTSVIGAQSKDLVINAPGVTVDGGAFSGGIKIAAKADGTTIKQCFFKHTGNAVEDLTDGEWYYPEGDMEFSENVLIDENT